MNTPDIKTLKKVIANQANKQEASDVIHWMNTSEGESFLSNEIDADLQNYTPEIADDYLDAPVPKEEMFNFILQQIRQRQWKKRIWKAAAVLLPFILVVSQFYYFGKQTNFFGEEEYTEICAPKGEKLHVAFQDGSQVLLNAGSMLRYPNKFSFHNRKVELTGEGYFQVVKNPNRPFIVDAKSLQIEVKGTTFNVKAYEEDANIEVYLETGKVSLLKGNRNIKDLEPGEQANYNKKTGECMISKVENSNIPLKWTHNTLSFDNTSLSEVLSQLSQRFGKRFIVKTPHAFSYNFTLATEDTTLNDILEELNKLSPVTFTLLGDTSWVEKK